MITSTARVTFVSTGMITLDLEEFTLKAGVIASTAGVTFLNNGMITLSSEKYFKFRNLLLLF
ncbi:hypothetical protein GCM10023231_32460 [Olivibacter ginsenosidimutans]|uniref:Uncharacterized protein n=1 Tax=Olivibacter ginsenosidimutans TaxID=1176537 RepID=A0ABP9BVU0_9SPHI